MVARRGGRARPRSPPRPRRRRRPRPRCASPNCSVNRTAPTLRLNRLVDDRTVAERELRAPAAGVEDDDRPVAEPDRRSRRRDGRAGPRPRPRSPRARRPTGPAPSRRPRPGCSRCAVPPCRPRRWRATSRRRASSAISLIACAVRSSGSAPISPVASRPSPSRVTTARSTTVRQAPPSGSSSATWNLVEFVPASMTAYRSGTPSTSSRSPVGTSMVDVGAEAERLDRGQRRPPGPWTRRRSTSSGVRSTSSTARSAWQPADGVAGAPLVDAQQRAGRRAYRPPRLPGAASRSRPSGGTSGGGRSETPGRPSRAASASRGNVALRIGSQRWRPAASVSRRTLTSISPSRTLTLSPPRAQQVELLALLDRPAPSPRTPHRRVGTSLANVRHSQRGTISPMALTYLFTGALCRDASDEASAWAGRGPVGTWVWTPSTPHP